MTENKEHFLLRTGQEERAMRKQNAEPSVPGFRDCFGTAHLEVHPPKINQTEEKTSVDSALIHLPRPKYVLSGFRDHTLICSKSYIQN